MIFIFAAHYGEVENIIRNKKMGKRKISFPFLQYSADGWDESGAKKEQMQAGKELSAMKESKGAYGRILLTICGEGRNNAAAAVAATLAKEGAKRGDILLSLGSAAVLKGAGEEHSLGQWFLLHALEEAGSGRAFYPELLYQTDFPTARLITGDRVLRHSDVNWATETKSYSSKEKELSQASDGQEGTFPEENLLYDMESTAVFQSANAFLSLENLFFLRCATDFGVGEAESGQSI